AAIKKRSKKAFMFWNSPHWGSRAQRVIRG
ncbi:MAG: hypothetical protein ACI83I_001984, partial [Bacteroidia bacterium]